MSAFVLEELVMDNKRMTLAEFKAKAIDKYKKRVLVTEFHLIDQVMMIYLNI